MAYAYRTYKVPLNAGRDNLSGTWPAKDPQESWLYTLDLTAVCDDAGTMINPDQVAVRVSDAQGLTGGGIVKTTKVIRVRLQGGIAGQTSVVAFAVGFMDGSILTINMSLPIVAMAPVLPPNVITLGSDPTPDEFGYPMNHTLSVTVPGTVSADEHLLVYRVPAGYVLPPGLAGAHGDVLTPDLATSRVFTLQLKRGMAISTIAAFTFAAMANTAIIVVVSIPVFIDGDILLLTAPSVVSPTQADFGFTIPGRK